MTYITVAEQKDKTPWRRCGCTETCRSAYNIQGVSGGRVNILGSGA